MSNENKTFHESWHRISGQRISLHSNIQARRQLFRGARWYVLQDPYSNQFYRLRPASYAFVSRLDGKRTVEDVWKERVEKDPNNAPGQGDIIELLAQLYHANLLRYTLAPDSAKLFDRFKKRRQRIVRANMLNIMFFRIPLFDPDNFLKRLKWIIRGLFSTLGGLVWLGMVGYGVKLVMENWEGLKDQSQGILAPSNLILLYAGLVIIKTLHEFGHAFAVRRFGGEVHTMGVMFLIFNPLPYMDASAAWSFRSKWKRALVGASGMIVELFVASIALVVWVHTGQGALNSLAYNIIFIASVSAILFNINPLLRFDGYYILSDILDIPNLHQQSQQHLTYLLERFAFGYKKAETPVTGFKDGFWLTTFGVLSSIYRIVVFTGILLFVADRFLLAGIIMAVICAISWLVVPVVKFAKYISTSPKLERVRTRAILVSSLTILILLSVVYFLPVPASFNAPGVLKAKNYKITVNEGGGVVSEIITPSGSNIKPGQPLIQMKNPELDFKIAEAEAALSESDIRYQKAMQEAQSDLKPIASRIEFYEKRLKRLNKEKDDLTIKATLSGLWVSPQSNNMTGMWLQRGTVLGQQIDPNEFYFTSVVSQQDVSRLFSRTVKKARVKVKGQAQVTIPVSQYKSIPMEQTHLPSSALGFGAGGDVATDMSDERGVKTTEPFYEVRANLEEVDNVLMLHGRSGKIRFGLPMEPLLKQGWRALRQMLQKRYQI